MEEVVLKSEVGSSHSSPRLVILFSTGGHFWKHEFRKEDVGPEPWAVGGMVITLQMMMVWDAMDGDDDASWYGAEERGREKLTFDIYHALTGNRRETLRERSKRSLIIYHALTGSRR